MTYPLRFADTYTAQIQVSNPAECGEDKTAYDREVILGWGGYSCTNDVANCLVTDTAQFVSTGSTTELTFTFSMIATDTLVLDALTNSCVHAGAGTGTPDGLTTTGIITFESGCNLGNCTFTDTGSAAWDYSASYAALHDGTGWITRGNNEFWAGFSQAISIPTHTPVCVKCRVRGTQLQQMPMMLFHFNDDTPVVIEDPVNKFQVDNEWYVYTHTYTTTGAAESFYIGTYPQEWGDSDSVHYQIDAVCLGVGETCEDAEDGGLGSAWNANSTDDGDSGWDDEGPPWTPTPSATSTPEPGDGYCPAPTGVTVTLPLSPLITFAITGTHAISDWRARVITLTDGLTWSVSISDSAALLGMRYLRGFTSEFQLANELFLFILTLAGISLLIFLVVFIRNNITWLIDLLSQIKQMIPFIG